MIRRPPRSTLSSSSAASDVYKRQRSTAGACHTVRGDRRGVRRRRRPRRRRHRADRERDVVLGLRLPRARRRCRTDRPRPRVVCPRTPPAVETRDGGTLALWNLGNGSVLAGVLLDLTALVDIGGIALVIALVLALRTVHRSTGPALLLRAYWLLVVVLGLSIPIGLVLSRIRGG